MLHPKPGNRLSRHLQAPSIPSRKPAIPSTFCRRGGTTIPASKSVPHCQPKLQISKPSFGPTRSSFSACRIKPSDKFGQDLPCTPRLLCQKELSDLLTQKTKPTSAFSSRVDRFPTRTQSALVLPSVGQYNIDRTSLKKAQLNPRSRQHTPVVIHKLPKYRVPSPTRYTLPRKAERHINAARASFDSPLPRFPKIQVGNSPHAWTYDVRVDATKPKAARTSSLRYTGPRMRRSGLEKIEMNNLLEQLTRAVVEPPKETVEVPVKSTLAKLRHGPSIVKPRQSRTVSLWTETQLPGPGAYDIGKYSSFEQRDPRATFMSLRKLKEAREKQVRVTRR
ncbi:hypothetical protein RvY_16732 [Ramazzottius varieornatus]|uniref:Uncharacterized protein n=1 Tax=Ramazzottius varieornatus TaxID=947166 RepID=A0A1D1W0N4_RAMVA|nr:hypothetical protein RvY_16732 [Ramazzottius varieornatus]